MSHRVCAHCGTPINPARLRSHPTQQHCSRACAVRRVVNRFAHAPEANAKRRASLRAHWADPTNYAARVAAVRAARGRERQRHWWHRAHLDTAWAQLARTTDLEALSARDQLRIKAAWSRAMRRMYQRGYVTGYNLAGRQKTEVA